MAVAPDQAQTNGRSAEDPFNVIHTVRVRKGRISKATIGEVPWDAFSTKPFSKKKAKDRERTRPPEKIHPVLKDWIATRSGDEREQVLVRFRSDFAMPRFP